jgi:hypothetical protein
MTTISFRTKINDAIENNKYIYLDASTVIDVYHDQSNTVLPGNGVFSKIDLFPGDYATFYSGWIISKTDAKLIKDENAHSHIRVLISQYTMLLGVDSTTDLQKFAIENRGYASFTNHSKNGNVEFETVDQNILMKVRKHIPANSEILVSYGNNYWKDTYNRTINAKTVLDNVKEKSSQTQFNTDTPTKKRTRFSITKNI